MFCADYISAFIFHAGISYGIWRSDTSNPSDLSDTSTTSATSDQFKILRYYLHGAASGLLGALVIYPFDFVRQGANTSRHVAHVSCLFTFLKKRQFTFLKIESFFVKMTVLC